MPFGSLSAPGAGMMPKVMAALMIAFSLLMIAASAESPPAATLDWSDRGHAARVVLITAIAVALYTRLGFLITMSLLVFCLLVVVERRNPLVAALYSIGLTLFAYWLFDKMLRSPLEPGVLWF
ncbi:MAG TPA: tripartite tricarboxylate transporter TctB family protein [Burkholderiales bacterium]|nr:tripartite tricarboxylate transporter TctB family protein [Burkholderiales bacterium]